MSGRLLLCPAAKGCVIGSRQIQSHQVDHKIHEPFGLAQAQHSKCAAQHQRRLDREIGIAGLPS